MTFGFTRITPQVIEVIIKKLKKYPINSLPNPILKITLHQIYDPLRVLFNKSTQFEVFPTILLEIAKITSVYKRDNNNLVFNYG